MIKSTINWYSEKMSFLSNILLTATKGNDKSASLFWGRIAQLGERRPYKPDVAGSSPVLPTRVLMPKSAVKLFLVLHLTFKVKIGKTQLAFKRAPNESWGGS